MHGALSKGISATHALCQDTPATKSFMSTYVLSKIREHIPCPVRRKSVNFSLLRITAIREGLRIGAQETARAGTATILCVIEYGVGSGILNSMNV